MSTSTKELANMTLEDLQKEIRKQRLTVAQLRTTVRMGKEKNSSKYTNAKKALAQLMTALSSKRIEKRQNDLLERANMSNVSAPATASAAADSSSAS